MYFFRFYTKIIFILVISSHFSSLAYHINMAPGKRTRSKSGGFDPDIVFPTMPQFMPPSQLPTIKSVIGVLKHMTCGGAAKTKHSDAVRETSKLVYAKWYHDTVYCISLSSVARRIEDIWLKYKHLNENF